MATRLFLVRHGESTWNADGRWQGQADPPLSALGARQAEAAVAGFIEQPDAVWTSDLVRSARTAEILAAGLGLPPPRPDARLREREVGEWSGLTRAEIEDGWPGYLAERRSPPGFEADAQLGERAEAALHDLARHGPGITILVVTHGGVIRTLERGLGGEAAPPIPNLGGRWVVVDDAGELVLGERRLLIDPDDIEVTVPPPR
ncbi:MAG: histidine phosphatase family protein [Acidimicrobiia bacterium]